MDEWFKSDGAKLARGTYRDVADHIDHLVKVAGIDHVGIGSDFDGITMWPVGLDDVSSYPRLTEELLRRGYSEADIHKILGANVLRAFRQAGEVAKRLAGNHAAGSRRDQAGKTRRLISSQRLQILDQVHPLFLGQVVAEGVAAVAHAEAGGVDDELGLKRRPPGRRCQLVGADLGELPADVGLCRNGRSRSMEDG